MQVAQAGVSFVTYGEPLKGAEGSTRKAEVLRRLGGQVRQVPVPSASQAVHSH